MCFPGPKSKTFERSDGLQIFRGNTISDSPLDSCLCKRAEKQVVAGYGCIKEANFVGVPFQPVGGVADYLS